MLLAAAPGSRSQRLGCWPGVGAEVTLLAGFDRPPRVWFDEREIRSYIPARKDKQKRRWDDKPDGWREAVYENRRRVGREKGKQLQRRGFRRIRDANPDKAGEPKLPLKVEMLFGMLEFMRTNALLLTSLLALACCGGGPVTQTGNATSQDGTENFTFSITGSSPYNSGTIIVYNDRGQAIFEGTIQKDAQYAGQGWIKDAQGNTIGDLQENPAGSGKYVFNETGDTNLPSGATGTLND